MMNIAERAVPIATAQMQARWMRLGSRPQPNSHSPRNVDSRKNAASPSMASGAPNTSPTNREYADQFIPNWNSCTSPVTTPIAMLMTRSVPKNLVSRLCAGLSDRCHMVCRIATRNANPIVTGTNRKW